MRVLFGHQSVGENLIQGLHELGVDGFAGSIVAMPDGALPAIQGELLLHARVGSNGDPQSKLHDFNAKLTLAAASGIDLALVKFCYVDVVEQSAAQTLWAAYREFIAKLQADFAALQIGHVTVPLRAAPTGFVARVRQSIQGAHAEHRRNSVRCWFNDQLRRTYSAGGLLFDLAALESRQSNGREVFSKVEGQRVHSLAQEWTYDGGHLNEEGRKMVAAAFLNYLRDIERQRTKAGSL